MDKKTYEALKIILNYAEGTDLPQVIPDSFKSVEDWIDEVAKEYAED